MLIDLHGHQVTRGMTNRDDHWGPVWTREGLKIGSWVLGSKTASDLGPDTEPGSAIFEMMKPENRLAMMDELGVDKLVVSVPSHMYMYWTGDFGTRYASIVNEELAAFCSSNPDRFAFWGHAALQEPESAAKELERAVLQLGAKGLSMGGANFGGLELYDEALNPVWEKVCELDVPIFVHGYNQSVTWGDKAMDDPFDTTSIVGMCYDEAKSYWYLVNGGVLDRFPDLKVYITHGGGYVPYQLGRFEETNLTMCPDSKNEKPFSEYRRNFWFDPLVHSKPMRKAIVEEIGVDRLLYGDNFAGADSIRYDLTEGLGLSDADREKIRSGNAIELLKL
jgi:aminocarboxymuconate-semialdehyde decarboxylase